MARAYHVVSCEISIENPPRARQPPGDCRTAGFGRAEAETQRNLQLRHRTHWGPWRSLRMTRSWSPASCRRHHLEITSARGLVAPAVSRARRRPLWICLALLLVLASGAAAQAPDSEPSGAKPLADQEPITPIPPPPAAEPRKLAL